MTPVADPSIVEDLDTLSFQVSAFPLQICRISILLCPHSVTEANRPSARKKIVRGGGRDGGREEE